MGPGVGIRGRGKPYVVVTRPPPAGLAPYVVARLNELLPDRIVYVSCNAATQARDVQLLSENYTVTRMRTVDMFPHTHHVENVALLELKTNN
mgnify:CR=1 FL=1